VGAFIPFFNWVSIAIAVAGLIVGIIALTRSGRPKAAAGVGTGLSVVALILSVILAIAYTVVFVHIWNNQQNIDTRPGAGTTEIPLVYQAGGTSHSATITYTTYDGVRSSTEQSTDAQLPFEKDLTTETGGAATYLSYTLTVTNGSDGGDVSCRIILDGTTIAEQHSSGAYTTASCTASGTQILK
jgi:amino acid transporter